MTEAGFLARHSRAAMIAPAGCGKTEVIAAAIAQRVGTRELVLTHTHAGVDAIRQRLKRFNVQSRYYEVQTIAGWALGLASAFPKTSGHTVPLPKSNSEYEQVYSGAARLLTIPVIREVLHASYTGVYVDEYQDCTVQQHELIVALRNFLPCRILGDPLQGIFGFRDNRLVQWEEHVCPHFEELKGPRTPWRWAKSHPALGKWLQEVREKLESDQEIDLRGAPVSWINGSDPKKKQQAQVRACNNANRAGESAIAIAQMPNQCHSIAKFLGGRFSCIEAIDSKDLHKFAALLEDSTGHARAKAVIDFASECMTQVKTELGTIQKALLKGTYPRIKKHIDCLDALRVVCETPSLVGVRTALLVISKIPGRTIYRRELFSDMLRSIDALCIGEVATLKEAVWVVRNRTRQHGRRLPRCAVGTTLLVKGLEFDHAVVLDADLFDAQNLYVALTRGRKSLTIVSQSMTIRPIESKRR